MAKGISSCVHIELDERLKNDRLSESYPSLRFHRIREARESGERSFSSKNPIYNKKRSFRSELSRISENGFRITTIHAIFASNIKQDSRMKTIDDTPPDLSGRP